MDSKEVVLRVLEKSPAVVCGRDGRQSLSCNELLGRFTFAESGRAGLLSFALLCETS